jgi:protein associated with RNAse G/E
VDESSASQSGEPIIVSALKYDGSEHRNWPGQLVVNDPPLLIVDALFVEDVQHELLGAITKGTISTEYYWLDRWYNIFRFGDKKQQNATFYCNVTIPPRLENGALSYVDLDIDVFVHSDFTYEILDVEDFNTNTRLYSYPKEIERYAYQAVEELKTLIDKRDFPFDR